MNNNHFPCVVSIAGTDPSGGAGIQADIKSISATGSYAASVITVLVSQNTLGVDAIYPISPDFVANQIDSVFNDLHISAVKIGMLYSRDIIEVVLSAIKKYKPNNIVLDPVIMAKDKSLLLKLSDLEFLKDQLFPNTHIITPNLMEAEYISSEKISSLEHMEDAAKRISEQYQTNVLIKGGHLEGNQSSDVLFTLNKSQTTWFHSKRVYTNNTHGTGCSLSSAIASYLAQHYSLEESVNLAKSYLSKAIKGGSKIQIDQGNGPVDHFFFLRDSIFPMD